MYMITVLYIIIGLLVAGFAILFYFLMDLKNKANVPQDNESMKVMMEWMRDIKQGTDNTQR